MIILAVNTTVVAYNYILTIRVYSLSLTNLVNCLILPQTPVSLRIVFFRYRLDKASKKEENRTWSKTQKKMEVKF